MSESKLFKPVKALKPKRKPKDVVNAASTKHEERTAKAIKDFIEKNKNSYLLLSIITPTDYIIGRRFPVTTYEVNNNNPFHPYEKKTEGYHCAFAHVCFKEGKINDKLQKLPDIINEMRTIKIESYRINKPEEVYFYLSRLGKI